MMTRPNLTLLSQTFLNHQNVSVNIIWHAKIQYLWEKSKLMELRSDQYPCFQPFFNLNLYCKFLIMILLILFFITT